MPLPVSIPGSGNMHIDFGPTTARSALIIDEDPRTRRLLGWALGREGFHCKTVPNLAEALRANRFRPFVLIVLSLQVPADDHERRQFSLLKLADDPLFVVLTEQLEPAATDELLRCGVDEIYLKPLSDYGIFSFELKTLVDARFAEQEAFSPWENHEDAVH